MIKVSLATLPCIPKGFPTHYLTKYYQRKSLRKKEWMIFKGASVLLWTLDSSFIKGGIKLFLWL